MITIGEDGRPRLKPGSALALRHSREQRRAVQVKTAAPAHDPACWPPASRSLMERIAHDQDGRPMRHRAARLDTIAVAVDRTLALYGVAIENLMVDRILERRALNCMRSLCFDLARRHGVTVSCLARIFGKDRAAILHHIRRSACSASPSNHGA